MKKKGLIISTIVMVVVLIASLTTATYAWFQVSSTTMLEGFNVSISTNNDVRIGLKADNRFVTSASQSEDDYRTGAVTYTPNNDGKLAGTAVSTGSWAGTQGLSASIDHNISWGAQKKAVGFRSESTDATTGETSLLSSFGSVANAPAYVYSANGTASTLEDIAPALANLTPAVSQEAEPTVGDYVYLNLGVTPTTTLTKSELVILVDASASASATCGILGSLHIVYRVNGASTWTDVDVFGANAATALLSTFTPGLADTANDYQEVTTYGDTYKQGNTPAVLPSNKAVAVKIALQATAPNTIDQVEIYMFLDGSDSDCGTEDLNNATAEIKLFFVTLKPAANNG